MTDPQPGERIDNPTPYDRLTVSLVRDASIALDGLQLRHQGMKKNDLVNRALRLLDFIDSELEQGNKLFLMGADGALQRVHII